MLATVRPPLPFTRFSEVAAHPMITRSSAGQPRDLPAPHGQPSVTQLYALRLDPATGAVRLTALPIPLTGAVAGQRAGVSARTAPGWR